MMTGRPPATPMSVLAGKGGDAWTVEELDVSCEQMQSWVAGWVREQEDLRCDVVKRVREQRERVREVSGRGDLPVFEVSDYVLVARVRKPVVCLSSYRPGLDRGVLCLEDQSMFV